MAAAVAALHAPVATPLPEPPPPDFITDDQLQVLCALLDGVLPGFVPLSETTDKGGAHKSVAVAHVALADDEFNRALGRALKTDSESRSREALASFLKHRPSEDPEFRDMCLRMLSANPKCGDLIKVLGLLNTRIGSLLLTGYWAPITQQPARVRHSIIQSWTNSRFQTLQLLAKSIVLLAHNADAVTSPLVRSMSGYDDVPKDWKARDGYDFDFIQVPPGGGGGGDDDDAPHIITTDVVIIGSGCGGGVTAKNLAEAGHRVLVVDKGYYFPPSHLPMPQSSAQRYLYDNKGVYLSENGSSSVVAGGAWGGGGTVNWSVCLKLQDYVRKEWSDEGRLPFFTSQQFDESCARVCDFVGVGTSGIRHNHSNRALLDGARRLGWKAAEAPQNTAGKEHYCGQCHLGCGLNEKRGPAASWLPAAGEAGAEFMEGFQADRVIFADDGKTAIGVEGLWTSRDANGGVHTPESERTQRKVVIKAKRVVVSAGSLWSPMILMKSGIKNKQLGQNLHIHPCNFVTGVWDNPTRPWEGGIITGYSSEFENLDGMGHGVKLEPTCMVPYTTLAMRPWSSGLESKIQSINYNHMGTFISLTRDRDTGSVFPDGKTGVPRIAYSASDFDAEHTLDGVQALAKICYVSGAREIRAQLWNIDAFVVDDEKRAKAGAGADADGETKDPEFTDKDFADWLARLRRAGNKPPISVWTSAHQMGTCRMGATEDEGVVDGRGRVWGREGLYVADGSVFPSASGVNPMLTIMTVADMISRGLAEDLRS